MIPLIATGGPPKAGAARSGDTDACEPAAGFAGLMDQPAEDDPQEADPDAVPSGLACAPLPTAPKPQAADDAPSAQPDPASRPAVCAQAQAVALPPMPSEADQPAAQARSGKTSATVQSDGEITVSSSQAAPAPPSSARQGPAEIAMRAALQPDATLPDLPADLAEPPDPAPDLAPDAGAGLAAPDLPPAAGDPAVSAQPPAPARGAVNLHPGQVVAQIVPKAQAQNGEVELLLAPEELGKLRFVIQADGASVKISLTAERPETLDMLRRHADQLVQEFRQSGYSGATIDFGSWKNNGQQGQEPQPAPPDEPVAGQAVPVNAAPPTPLAAIPLAPGKGGLNLRL